MCRDRCADPGLRMVARLAPARYRRRETVCPEQNRGKCFGIAGWLAANAEGRGSNRFCGATYRLAVTARGRLVARDRSSGTCAALGGLAGTARRIPAHAHSCPLLVAARRYVRSKTVDKCSWAARSVGGGTLPPSRTALRWTREPEPSRSCGAKDRLAVTAHGQLRRACLAATFRPFQPHVRTPGWNLATLATL